MSIAPTEHAAPVLTHADRCGDRCPSRAYTLVVLKWSPGLPHAGELSFCAHHMNMYEDAIAPYTSLIIDERWTLTEHVRDDKHIN